MHILHTISDVQKEIPQERVEKTERERGKEKKEIEREIMRKRATKQEI